MFPCSEHTETRVTLQINNLFSLFHNCCIEINNKYFHLGVFSGHTHFSRFSSATAFTSLGPNRSRHTCTASSRAKQRASDGPLRQKKINKK